MSRKFSGTRKAGKVNRGKETLPGTAGEDARDYTATTVTAPPPPPTDFLPFGIQEGPFPPAGHTPATSDPVSEPLATHPQTPAAKKLGAPVRPGYEEM